MNNTQRLTLASFLAYFVMSGMLAPIGIISGPMAELFGESITAVTARFSWLTIGNLCGAALALVIFDVLRLRTVFLLAYVLTVASLLTLTIGSNLTMAGIALGVVGVCSGLGLASAALIISRSYAAERRASMLVITDASFSVAGFSCAAIATAMIAAGWHWASIYQLVAAIALVIVGLALLSTFPDTAAAEQDDAARETWPMSVWFCIGALFLYTLGQYSMLWWLPNYAETRLGASVEQSGRLVALFWMGMFAAQLLVAWLVIRMGVQRLVVLAAITTCLFSIPLWLVGNLALLPVLAFLWGLANFGMLKVVLSFATQMLKVPSGRLVSTLLLGATLGTAVSPWVTSGIVVATNNRFILQFSTACYAALAVLLLLAVKHYAGRNAAQPDACEPE